MLAASLSACGWNQKAEPPPSGETFGANDTFSRTYAVPAATACEATRRALLGQGYVIGEATTPDTLQASKNFQPEDDIHTQLLIRATCLAQTGGGSIVFVNAVQDRYALNSTLKSASVGVSMLGSVSLPIGSSVGNLVKVASNTVQSGEFYTRFFDLVAYYVPSTEALGPPPPPPVFEALPEPEPLPVPDLEGEGDFDSGNDAFPTP